MTGAPITDEQRRAARECITPGCGKPAGTSWSPYWCPDCNTERMNRISRNLEQIRAELVAQEETPNAAE